MTTKRLITLLLPVTLGLSISVNGQRTKVNLSDLFAFYKQEVKNVNLIEGDTLLDIGSGEGMVNAMYSVVQNNLHQVLMDTDPKTMNKKNVSNSYKAVFKSYKSKNTFSFDLIYNTEDSMPLNDKSFHKILCRRSFHEFKKPEDMLGEIHRILKDTGCVVVIEGVPRMPNDIDPTCKLEYLRADTIIKTFTKNRFQLVFYMEETMPFDNNRKLSVLTFKKDTANIN